MPADGAADRSMSARCMNHANTPVKMLLNCPMIHMATEASQSASVTMPPGASIENVPSAKLNPLKRLHSAIMMRICSMRRRCGCVEARCVARTQSSIKRMLDSVDSVPPVRREATSAVSCSGVSDALGIGDAGAMTATRTRVTTANYDGP